MIKEKFLETIEEYKLIKPKDKVLVAVSGGADSTALLCLLDAYKTELGITLHVAHLNHLIRKGDAELDARFVQQLAQARRLPVTIESVDVQRLAQEKGLGLEEAARKARYAFFEKTARLVGANKIAVGHTADDNVETFLMRLLRGAGIKGLTGIPVRRGQIVRPLIKIWRKEIEDYVGGQKLVPRRDYTNYESKFMRNRVRLKLIPQLKVYNLNIKEIILQTILLLTEDHSFMEARADEALVGATLAETENELKLDNNKIAKNELPIQGHLIRRAIQKIKGDLVELSFKHVHDILEKLGEREKWELHLPAGLIVQGSASKLIISKEKPTVEKRLNYRYQLAVPGEVEIKESGRIIAAELVDKSGEGNDPRVAYIDYSALGKTVVVRSRQDGDRFMPLGMRSHKKLQDLFVDEKVPAEERDAVPVVESGGRIVWVAGLRLDERAKIKTSTKKIVKLELR